MKGVPGKEEKCVAATELVIELRGGSVSLKSCCSGEVEGRDDG